MNAARQHPVRRTAALLCALGALCGASAAMAAPANDAQARYQQERSRCLSGQSHQDRQTCLQEAGAALGEARKGRLDNGQAERYEQNALMRCNALPVADRDECQARMRGEGTTSGSVESGGIYRELVTVEPAPEGTMPDAPSTTPASPMMQSPQN